MLSAGSMHPKAMVIVELVNLRCKHWQSTQVTVEDTVFQPALGISIGVSETVTYQPDIQTSAQADDNNAFNSGSDSEATIIIDGTHVMNRKKVFSHKCKVTRMYRLHGRGYLSHSQAKGGIITHDTNRAMKTTKGRCNHGLDK